MVSSINKPGPLIKKAKKMDRELASMAELLTNTSSTLKIVREDAEESLAKAIAADLNKFCELLLALLKSRLSFTEGNVDIIVKITGLLLLKAHFKQIGKRSSTVPSVAFIEALQTQLLNMSVDAQEVQLKKHCSTLLGEVQRINNKTFSLMYRVKAPTRLLDSDEFWKDIFVCLHALRPELEKGHSKFLVEHKKEFYDALVRGVKGENTSLNLLAGETIAEICKDCPPHVAKPITQLLLQLLSKQGLIDNHV